MTQSKSVCPRFRRTPLNHIDEDLSTTDNRITILEATCNELQVGNGLLRAKVNDLEGRAITAAGYLKQVLSAFCASQPGYLSATITQLRHLINRLMLKGLPTL